MKKGKSSATMKKKRGLLREERKRKEKTIKAEEKQK
jgi:hypothetical protein